MHCFTSGGRLRGRVGVALVLLLVSLTAGAFDGAFDPSFAPDSGGRRLLDVDGGTSDSGSRVLITSGGKLLMAGTCVSTLCLARLTSDGSDDATFHAGSTDVAALSGGTFPSSCTLADMAVLSDERIVLLASCTTVKVVIAVVTKFGLSLDSNVGGGKGWIETDLGLNDSTPYAMKVQTDGKIVIAGYAKDTTNNIGYMAATRWLADFSARDPAFAGGGVRNVDFGQNFGDIAQARATTIQSNGSIILAGIAAGTGQVAVARLLADGSLDNNASTGFGAAHSGKTTLSFAGYSSASLRAVAADGSDRIVFGGLASTGTTFRWLVDRLTADGVQDAAFSGGSAQFFSFQAGATGLSSDGPAVNALALQTDGKIVAVGTIFRPLAGSPTSATWWGAARFTSAGALDKTFGNSGLQFSTFYDGPTCCGYSDVGTSVALDTHIVIAGHGNTTSFATGSVQFGITRLTLNDYIFADKFE